MEKNSTIIKKAAIGFRFTLVAQILVLVLGIVKSLLLPKILEVDEFGYWQIYVLYSTYVGVFMLGFNDGVYLIYGKYMYNELPFSKLRAANKWLIGSLILFTGLFCAISAIACSPDRKFAMIGVGADIILMGIYGLLIYILQITNQMKEYSIYSVLDKFIVLFFILVALLSGYVFSYKVFILIDVFSKLVVTIALVIRCKELFFGKSDSLSEGYLEYTNDVKTGISLMLAQLMGQLILGIGRFFIDLFGSIDEYAYYSFGISVTNLVLVFITAVSLVLYPALKRIPDNNYGQYFNKLNSGLVILSQYVYALYFPAVVFINWFLPKYSSIICYLHILFAVVVIQAKMQMIINTYYKVLRKEKKMLMANVVCVLIFVVVAVITYIPTHNTMMIAVSTFIAMIYRCYASEIYLRKEMKISISKKVIFEVLVSVIYVVMICFLPFTVSLILYLIYLLAYTIVERITIKNAIQQVQGIFK